MWSSWCSNLTEMMQLVLFVALSDRWHATMRLLLQSYWSIPILSWFMTLGAMLLLGFCFHTTSCKHHNHVLCPVEWEDGLWLYKIMISHGLHVHAPMNTHLKQYPMTFQISWIVIPTFSLSLTKESSGSLYVPEKLMCVLLLKAFCISQNRSSLLGYMTSVCG